MADDRMKNDDLQRNMGGAGREEGQNPGQQAPGRSGQGGQQGQHAGGYGGSQQGQQGTNFGTGQKDSRNMEDDEEFGAGGAGQAGGQNRGGQNR